MYLYCTYQLVIKSTGPGSRGKVLPCLWKQQSCKVCRTIYGSKACSPEMGRAGLTAFTHLCRLHQRLVPNAVHCTFILQCLLNSQVHESNLRYYNQTMPDKWKLRALLARIYLSDFLWPSAPSSDHNGVFSWYTSIFLLPKGCAFVADPGVQI